MRSISHPTIENAFAATRYRVHLDGHTHTLTIGVPSPDALSPWLTRHAGHAPAWLITAHNPHARPVEPAVNSARNAVLRQWLATRAMPTLASVNQDPAGAWPDEPGWLIAGLEQGMASTLGRRFDQLAIIAVSAAWPARLVWLR